MDFLPGLSTKIIRLLKFLRVFDLTNAAFDAAAPAANARILKTEYEISKLQGDSPVATASEITPKVTIKIYMESGCPNCQKFITQILGPVMDDKELAPYLDVDYFPWGNSYFGTHKCGHGPYKKSERQCWAKHCIQDSDSESDSDAQTDPSKASADPKTEKDTKDASCSDGKTCAEDALNTPDWCFTREAVYQHGGYEGAIDLYESCAKRLDKTKSFGFLRCAEQKLLDMHQKEPKRFKDGSVGPNEIMLQCSRQSKMDAAMIRECAFANGEDRNIEIENAKATPAHSELPYVIIDKNPKKWGEIIDGGFKQGICEALYPLNFATCSAAQKEEEV